MFPASLVASATPLAAPRSAGVLVHRFAAALPRPGSVPATAAAPTPAVVIMVSTVLVSGRAMVRPHQRPRRSSTASSAAKHSSTGPRVLLPSRPAVARLVLVGCRRWRPFAELCHEGHVLFVDLGLLGSVRGSEVAAAAPAAAETLPGALHDAILGDMPNATTALEQTNKVFMALA